MAYLLKVYMYVSYSRGKISPVSFVTYTSIKFIRKGISFDPSAPFCIKFCSFLTVAFF